MPGFADVVLLSALPAAGNIAGALIAEFVRTTQRAVSLALHTATGVVLAVVGVELIPRTLETGSEWVMIACFLTGGIAFIALDAAADLVSRRFGRSGETGPVMVWLATSVDLFTDGLLIGTGSAVATSLGLLLALGQVPADIPEGFATTAVLKRRGVPRTRRVLIAASFALPILAGSAVGWFLVRDRSEIWANGLLAIGAGILLTVTVEELVPQSHKAGDSRLATVFFLAGFVSFTILSALFGG